MRRRKTTKGEGRQRKEKEDNERRRRKTTKGEGRQRKEKKEDNERRRKTTKGEEGRQRKEKEDNERRRRKTTKGEGRQRKEKEDNERRRKTTKGEGRQRKEKEDNERRRKTTKGEGRQRKEKKEDNERRRKTERLTTVRRDKPNPWYNGDIADARRRRRKAESVWRRTKLEVHRQIFVAARDECNDLITEAKTTFYRDKLQYADNKSIFQIVRSLSGKPPPSYPDHDSPGECANTFSAYFNDKIAEMRTKLEGANNQCPAPVRETRRFLTPLVTFDATCVSEIELIIAKTSKTCHLDPMPSKHIKDNILSLASVVTDISNASLSEGVMRIN